MTAGSLDADFKLSTAPLKGGGKPLLRALVVSILVHLLLVALWLTVERRDAREITELVAIPFELIEPPAPPPPPMPAAERPPPPPPQLREAERAERSTPPPPQEEVAPPTPMPPAPPPVQARPAPRAETPPRPVPRETPPPAPRLADGVLTDLLQSPPSPPQPPQAAARPPPTAAAAVNRPLRTQAERNADRPPDGLPSERVTQSETDFLLSQILRNWLLDYRNPRLAEMILHFWFVLDPDGRVPPPLGGDGPLDFSQVILNYPDLVRASQLDPRYRDMRTALETFLVAARASLPFTPQPGAVRATGPRSMLIEFKLGDLPR
jgi:hypothetical protein